MTPTDYSGYWTGTIEGTNQGGFALDVRQEGAKIAGEARISEPALGQYEYLVEGTVGEALSVRLIPSRRASGVYGLGNVQVICSLGSNGTLSGRWKSDIGTEGTLTAKRFEGAALAPALPHSNSVFLVHGHDDGAKHGVARFLERLGIEPVILQEQINKGMTVIEKFEEFAARAGFAVVLMTPDDVGYPVGKEEEKKRRPRQNVVLELGYFAAKLGRDKTFVLLQGEVEMPSDVLGLVYESMDASEGWKIQLARELQGAGFKVDMNRALSLNGSD